MNYASDRKVADRVVEKIEAGRRKSYRCARKRDLVGGDRSLLQPDTEATRNVDILVNNAGVFSYLPLQDVNERSFIASSTRMCSDFS